MTMDLSKKEQTQTAGNNSIQNQFGNLNNCNVTVNDSAAIRAIATEVCSKEMLNVYARCTQDAIDLADKRNKKFIDIVIARLEKVESAINSLKDPAFQVMIQEARETAVKTDREEDWHLLSELLAYHIEKGNERKIDAGISRAIKIVNEIDNNALCALTLDYAISYFTPTSGYIKKGLSVLNELYGKFLYLPLPQGNDWIEHLDLLGTLRIIDFAPKRKFNEFIISRFEEYACVGIKKESQEHDLACELLSKNNISESVLVDNECLEGYVRLRYSTFNNIKPQYQDCIKKIIDVYSNDNFLIKKAQDNFIKIWDSYDNLKVAKEWWDSNSYAFNITYMGRVLAQTNAKRIDPSLPSLI